MSEHKGDTDWQSVAAALNSQLAAEREVGHNQAVTLGQQIARLEDQLAAERERYEALEKSVLDLSHPNFRMLQNDIIARELAAEREEGVKALAERSFELHECQKQLAAEREKYNQAVDHLTQLGVETARQLREQLAAAIEALQEIREAGYTLTRQDGTNVIDAALAKIQDKPVQLPMINDDPVVTLK